MFSKLFHSLTATLVFATMFLGAAQAAGIHYQALPNGVQVTILNVDSPDGPPPEGALHCITGTRRNWATSDGGRTFWLGQMIGGCVLPRDGQVTHAIHRDAVNSQGVLCLIPIWVDSRGRRLAWSSHPDGETQKTARSGGMITALKLLPDGNWRPATAAEAYGCD